MFAGREAGGVGGWEGGEPKPFFRRKISFFGPLPARLHEICMGLFQIWRRRKVPPMKSGYQIRPLFLTNRGPCGIVFFKPLSGMNLEGMGCEQHPST